MLTLVLVFLLMFVLVLSFIADLPGLPYLLKPGPDPGRVLPFVLLRAPRPPLMVPKLPFLVVFRFRLVEPPGFVVPVMPGVLVPGALVLAILVGAFWDMAGELGVLGAGRTLD
jgi:hypothetical protein